MRWDLDDGLTLNKYEKNYNVKKCDRINFENNHKSVKSKQKYTQLIQTEASTNPHTQ